MRLYDCEQQAQEDILDNKKDEESIMMKIRNHLKNRSQNLNFNDKTN